MSEITNLFVRRAIVTLTATQVKNLNSTPITLVAAPASGALIIVQWILFASTFVSAAYVGANNLEFRYTNASGVKVTADILAAVLDFASGTQYSLAPAVAAAAITPVAASPIIVTVPVANPTNGDSPVTFVTSYLVATP